MAWRTGRESWLLFLLWLIARWSWMNWDITDANRGFSLLGPIWTLASSVTENFSTWPPSLSPCPPLLSFLTTLSPIETPLLTPWLLSQFFELLLYSVSFTLPYLELSHLYKLHLQNQFQTSPLPAQPPILVKELPISWTILSPMNSNPLTLPFSSYPPAPSSPHPHLRFRSHHHHHSSNPLKIPCPLPSKMPIYNEREPIIHIFCNWAWRYH